MVDTSQLTSAVTHRVCAAPRPQSHLHSHFSTIVNCSLGLRPRVIPASSHQHKFFFSLGSLIFSLLNLAALLEIWVLLLVFRFGSRAFCGTRRCDGTTRSHLRASLRSAPLRSSSQQVLSLTEDSPVPPSQLCATQKKMQLLGHSWLGPAAREVRLRHQGCQDPASRGCRFKLSRPFHFL